METAACAARAGLPPPSHPAPAAHGSRSSQTVRHSLRRAVWRTRTQHLVPPPSAHLCTRRPSLHLTMLHTPSFSAGPALVTYSPAHAGLCGTWYTHAQPQSHTNAMWHPSHTQSPLQLSPAPPAARTHTPSLRARWMPASTDVCPPCLACWNGPALPLLLPASMPVSPTTHPTRPSPLQVVIADAPTTA